MYLINILYFVIVELVRRGLTCLPVKDPGGVVPIAESPLTCAPSTDAASLFVDDTVPVSSTSASLIRKCVTCEGGTVNYYKPGSSQYYTSSEIIGSLTLSQCSNLDGTCAVYGYIESDSIKLVPEHGNGVTYFNSDINVPVTNSDRYINAATISCDGCIQSSCLTTSQ
uniref:Secreted protein n=1 Tax=Panagrellus redivivus TaxID=6233 RepID=A0A7E4W6K7_PANRE